MCCLAAPSLYHIQKALVIARLRREKVLQGLKPEGVRTNRECLVGVSLPNFNIQTLDSEFSVNSLKGKRTVISFWESNCPPCIYSIPLYNKLKSELGSDEYNFISIGYDKKQEIPKKHEWSFTHALNGRELIDDVFQLYFGYPLTLLVDENLVITNIFPGASREKIESGEAYSKILAIITSNE